MKTFVGRAVKDALLRQRIDHFVGMDLRGVMPPIDYNEIGRMVLFELLHPTEAMVGAGFNAAPIPPMRASKEHYRLAWTAMLEEAMK